MPSRCEGVGELSESRAAATSPSIRGPLIGVVGHAFGPGNLAILASPTNQTPTLVQDRSPPPYRSHAQASAVGPLTAYLILPVRPACGLVGSGYLALPPVDRVP